MRFIDIRRALGVCCILIFVMMSAMTMEEPKKAKSIEILLLTALPGSGKSEVRRYLSTLSPKECCEYFGIGPIVQLDDFPYVYMMRRITDEATKRGYEGIYYRSPALPFKDPTNWGTLVHLINEDYRDLVEQRKPNPSSAAVWLFDRLDAAYIKVGGEPLLGRLPLELRQEIAQAVEADAAKLLENKLAEIDKAKNLNGKTIVVEFSRGGADASPMPLPAPFGYGYSLAQLSPEILSKASILYIEVSPQESRRKNEARANPNDPGSILSHMVPRAVMYTEYGTDDISWLEENSAKIGVIAINAHDKMFYLSFGRFDNKVDKTTFAHADPAIWKRTDVQNLRTALNKAFASLTGCTA